MERRSRRVLALAVMAGVAGGVQVASGQTLTPPNGEAFAQEWAYGGITSVPYTQVVAGTGDVVQFQLVVNGQPTTGAAFHSDVVISLRSPNGTVLLLGGDTAGTTYPGSVTFASLPSSGTLPPASTAAQSFSPTFDYNFGPVAGTWEFNFRNQYTGGSVPWNDIQIVLIGNAPGACCLPSGVCSFISPQDCASQGGAFQGGGVTCGSVVCPEPGACCFTGGSCMVTLPANCTAMGGTFNGVGTTCAAACPPPTNMVVPPPFTVQPTTSAYPVPYTQDLTGAFNANAVRLVVNAQAATGGSWQSDMQMTLSSPNGTVLNIGSGGLVGWTEPGVFATGSAPAATGDPQAIDAIYLMDMGPTAGTWSVNFFHDYVDGTLTWQDIQITPMNLPSGSCCFGDGTCAIRVEAACTGSGGSYRGDNTDCSTPCPQPGACCLANGGCVTLSEAECTTMGGTYQGSGSNCGQGQCWTAPVLWHNGSVVTHVGGGTGGFDASQLPAGADTIGENVNYAVGVRVADDFTVPAGAMWTINRIRTWAYQTGSFGFTMTNFYARIWDRDPADPAAQLVWGENEPFVTNLMDPSASGQESIYRVIAPDLFATDRQLQRLEAAVPNVQLPAGTYWLEWSTTGSGGSGPFTPPVTVLDNIPRGNAQIWRAGPPWAPVTDAFWNGGTPVGLPFMLEGTSTGGTQCYANCDLSTTAPILNVADFTCFLQRFAGGESYANCDQSTTPPVLNVADFTCFLQSFAAGCP